MKKKLKGKVRKILETNEQKKLRDELIKSVHSGFWGENAEKIELDLVKKVNLSESWNKGCLFNESKELRWTGKDYWLFEEATDGDYELDESDFTFFARKNRKINGVKYIKNGLVQFIRFRFIE